MDKGPSDRLVPDPEVAREFGVSLMTIWRWSKDKALNFPPAVSIRRRNFRSRRALDAFKARMVKKATKGRAA